MKLRRIRILAAILATAILGSRATAQNAVTFWNSIAVGTAVKAKSTGGMTGFFLAYSNLAAFDGLNSINPRFQAYGGIKPSAQFTQSEFWTTKEPRHSGLWLWRSEGISISCSLQL